MLADGPEGLLIRARFSPRGDRVAMFRNVQQKGVGLWVMTWPGGDPRFLGAGLWPVGWSADGQWIYAHRHGDGAMLRVLADSGKSEPAGTFPGVTLEGGCDLTPDRRTMICALLERNADAWLVEHFDPQVSGR